MRYDARIPALLSVLAVGCTAAPPVAEGPPPPGASVILFLGDGMGVSTVTAARIFAGQLQGNPGEEHLLSFESFPNLALVKTYNVDSQVSDSAGTMSAIVTGEKTRIGVLGVGPQVERGDCAASLEGQLPTLLELAEERGLATGVVSTTRITHATPAATYAHVPDRGWESDTDLPQRARELGCRDIARQLVEFDHGDGIEVVLGGGRRPFFPTGHPDPEYENRSGIRADGRNLVEEWLNAGADRTYVWNLAELESLRPGSSEQVLGLFEPSHMQWEADRAGDPAGEPSLAEMTRFALRKLQASGKRFFLVVEGGRIDHGHHAGNAYRALVDTVALAEAVADARRLTDPADTLLLVTADHSHTLTLSGYPGRGNPILGKVADARGEPLFDTAGRPYTTLGYANGPGFRGTPQDLSNVDTEDPGYRQAAAVPLGSETHGGEDVAAYALGVNAEAVHGVMEQEELFYVMRKALLGGG